MKKILLFSFVMGSFAIHTEAQTFANASFETWNSYNVGLLGLEAPTQWHGVDSFIAGIAPLATLAGISIDAKKQLYKSTDFHTGSFAAEVRSANLGSSIGNAPGFLANAQVSFDALGALGDTANILNYVSFTGGTAITGQVDTVSAWVKVDQSNLDSGSVFVSAMKTYQGASGDSAVAIGVGTFTVAPSAEGYHRIAVPLDYSGSTEIPDRLIVAFASSDFAADTVHAGNKMEIDDVAFSYKTAGPVSIRQPLLSEQTALVYPVPATTSVYFNLNASVQAGDYQLMITDVSGKVICNEHMKTQINSKDVSKWAKGNYFYQITNTKNNAAQKGQFVVE